MASCRSRCLPSNAGHGERTEYIEYGVVDHRFAYDLLSDGVLENTIDDLWRPARQLLNLIEECLEIRVTADGVSIVPAVRQYQLAGGVYKP